MQQSEHVNVNEARLLLFNLNFPRKSFLGAICTFCSSCHGHIHFYILISKYFQKYDFLSETHFITSMISVQRIDIESLAEKVSERYNVSIGDLRSPTSGL